MAGRIIVGVDGSSAAAVALGWAAAEARLRDAELVACSVVEPAHGREASDVAAAQASLGEFTAGYPVRAVTLQGEAGEALVAAAEDADLLVVGSRGRSPLAASLLGSVSLKCVTQGLSPVVVVRQAGPPAPLGRVVVGIDGSAHSRAALLLASEEARLRGAALHIVHVVHWHNHGGEFITPTPDQLIEWGHTMVDDVLSATGVSGERLIIAGDPAEVLVDQAREADLLVLGTRGHNPVVGFLLGSVSEECIRHAPCPVSVVRADELHRSGKVVMGSTEVWRPEPTS